MTQIKLAFWAVVATLVAASMLGIYAKGRVDASHKAEIQSLKDDLVRAKLATDYLKKQTDRYNAIIEQHNARALQDAIKLSGMERQKEVILNEIENGTCLDPAATRRLCDYFASAGAGGACGAAANSG